jgi:hypothetical protein
VDPVLVPLVLFASLVFKDHQNLTWLLSGLLISKTLLPHAGSSGTLLFVCECPVHTIFIEKCTVYQIQYHLFRSFYTFPQN